MKAVTQIRGIVVPLDRENVDTDAIMPKQFLKATNKLGFGANLFDSWRFLDVGKPGQDPETRIKNPEFVLNNPAYKGAKILVARDNFGCGSSREHAPWGIIQYGIEAVIAPTFGDIFAANSLRNGLLVIELPAERVSAMIGEATRFPGFEMSIDLRLQVISEGPESVPFEIDPFRKECLLNAADDIALALRHSQAIRRYEVTAASQRPWLFGDVSL